MKSYTRIRKQSGASFSLVEVVLALGVVGFAIIAILGVIPVGLKASRGSQDETRAAHIAQSIFASLSSQVLKRDATGQPVLSGGQTQLNDAVKIPLPNNQSFSVDLTSSATPATASIYADNDGRITSAATGAAYAITILTNNLPPGFAAGDAGYANQVTLTIAWPAGAAAANQTKRDFVRVISKF